MSAVHPATGETARWVGGPGDRRLVHLHPVPRGRNGHATVVMCPPVLSEYVRDHRRRVVIARELADRGLSVVRVGYGGVGNSEGDEMTSVAAMVDDVARAVAELVDVDEPTILLGSRVGALVASAAAASLSSRRPGLLLLDPVIDGAAYLDELLRAVLFRKVSAGEEGRTRDGLRDEMSLHGGLDVMGYWLPAVWAADLETWMLEAALGSAPGRLGLLSSGGVAGTRRVLDDLATDLERRGWSTVTKQHGEPRNWLFDVALFDPSEERESDLAAARDTHAAASAVLELPMPSTKGSWLPWRR